MERDVSIRTKIIARSLLVPFVVGCALIIALLLCFAADLLNLWRDVVATFIPTIVALIVYDALAALLLRLALILSVRLDRAA